MNTKKNGDVSSSISYAILSAMFLFTWIWPVALGLGQVSNLAVLVLVEIALVAAFFFIVPLLLIMPALDSLPRSERSDREGFRKLIKISIGAVVLLFTPFVIIMPLYNGQYFALLLILYSVIIRVRVIKQVAKKNGVKSTIIVEWVLSMVLLLLTAPIVFALPMPRFGLSYEFMTAYTAAIEKTGSTGGIFTRNPEAALAFGVLYFGLLSYTHKFKWRIYRWAAK